MAGIQSRPYKPVMACERCVFGRGWHMFFCPAFMSSLNSMLMADMERINRDVERVEMARHPPWIGVDHAKSGEDFTGIAIIEDPNMPKDQAALMSSDGQVVIITGIENPK